MARADYRARPQGELTIKSRYIFYSAAIGEYLDIVSVT
jgi:hypothetical protein